MLTVFFHNMTLIITFIFMKNRLKDWFLAKNDLNGYNKLILLLSGVVSVLVMMDPFEYAGFFFDLRHVPLFIAAYQFGIGGGLLAGLIPLIFRVMIGGPGVMAGVIVGIIVPVFLAGFFGGRRFLEFPESNSLFDLRKASKYFILQELVRLSLLIWLIQIPFTIWLMIAFFSTLSLLGILIFTNDTNRRRQTEDQLRESEERYRLLVEVSPEPIVIHKNGQILFANPATLELANLQSLDQLIGQTIFDYMTEKSRKLALVNVGQLHQGKKIGSYEYEIVLPDKETKIIEASSAVITYRGQLAILAVAKDITERKKVEEQVSHMAFHDALTGLPNRYLLNDYFKRASSRAERKGKVVSVMFLDLDRFKLINDTLGHEVGDIVLQEVTRRLKKSVRESDVVFRHGGDEFIILLEEVCREDVAKVAQRIVDEFVVPFHVHGHLTYTSPSIGISLYPDDGKDVETLVKHADLAMYSAKEQGRNNYQFYTYSEEIGRRMQLELGLRTALENNEFVVHYQPQVDLRTQKFVGMEALLRWNHPTLGRIAPGEFIPIAEETGAIIAIGSWVLETACKQNVYWQQMGFEPIPVTVNISGLQILHKGFADTVKQVLKRTGLQPLYLELEISESSMKYKAELMEVLKELKEIGIKVTIDNFGTGYSILNLLKHVTFDNLKIDHTFIKELTDNANSVSLLKALIGLSQDLNFCIVAGGIEESEQVAFLKDMQCNVGQGFYFSKPLPSEEITKILAKQWISIH